VSRHICSETGSRQRHQLAHTHIYIYIYILYIYPPPCLKHVLVRLGSKQQSQASMLNLDPAGNLNHQCSILILIWMALGILHCPLRGSRPHYQCYLQRFPPQILHSFFDAAFWAPISPKGCPKVSIVRIWEPKRLHFGSHFGSLFGSGCKSEN
jgi:hypothetical protein